MEANAAGELPLHVHLAPAPPLTYDAFWRTLQRGSASSTGQLLGPSPPEARSCSQPLRETAAAQSSPSPHTPVRHIHAALGAYRLRLALSPQPRQPAAARRSQTLPHQSATSVVCETALNCSDVSTSYSSSSSSSSFSSYSSAGENEARVAQLLPGHPVFSEEATDASLRRVGSDAVAAGAHRCLAVSQKETRAGMKAEDLDKDSVADPLVLQAARCYEEWRRCFTTQQLAADGGVDDTSFCDSAGGRGDDENCADNNSNNSRSSSNLDQKNNNDISGAAAAVSAKASRHATQSAHLQLVRLQHTLSPSTAPPAAVTTPPSSLSIAASAGAGSGGSSSVAAVTATLTEQANSLRPFLYHAAAAAAAAVGAATSPFPSPPARVGAGSDAATSAATTLHHDGGKSHSAHSAATQGLTGSRSGTGAHAGSWRLASLSPLSPSAVGSEGKAGAGADGFRRAPVAEATASASARANSTTSATALVDGVHPALHEEPVRISRVEGYGVTDGFMPGSREGQRSPSGIPRSVSVRRRLFAPGDGEEEGEGAVRAAPAAAAVGSRGSDVAPSPPVLRATATATRPTASVGACNVGAVGLHSELSWASQRGEKSSPRPAPPGAPIETVIEMSCTDSEKEEDGDDGHDDTNQRDSRCIPHSSTIVGHEHCDPHASSLPERGARQSGEAATLSTTHPLFAKHHKTVAALYAGSLLDSEEHNDELQLFLCWMEEKRERREACRRGARWAQGGRPLTNGAQQKQRIASSPDTMNPMSFGAAKEVKPGGEALDLICVPFDVPPPCCEVYHAAYARCSIAVNHKPRMASESATATTTATTTPQRSPAVYVARPKATEESFAEAMTAAEQPHAQQRSVAESLTPSSAPPRFVKWVASEVDPYEELLWTAEAACLLS